MVAVTLVLGAGGTLADLPIAGDRYCNCLGQFCLTPSVEPPGLGAATSQVRWCIDCKIWIVGNSHCTYPTITAYHQRQCQRSRLLKELFDRFCGEEKRMAVFTRRGIKPCL